MTGKKTVWEFYLEILFCDDGTPSGAKKAREEIQHEELWGFQEPPLKILYVGLFPVFLKDKITSKD